MHNYQQLHVVVIHKGKMQLKQCIDLSHYYLMSKPYPRLDLDFLQYLSSSILIPFYKICYSKKKKNINFMKVTKVMVTTS